MPAPTALLKTSNETPAEVPLPSAAQDEELLLDAPEAVPSDPNAVAAPSWEPEDTEMVVDEEGRPRFAPGKDVVCFQPPPHLSHDTLYMEVY
jgi:RNA-binding protein PNO1